MRLAPTAKHQLSVSLALEIGEEPVAGTVVVSDGHARSFSGWFELVGLLEEAVSVARRAENQHRPRKGRIAKPVRS